MITQIPEAFGPLLAPAQFKGYYGGRGGAKSHAFAEVLIIQSLEWRSKEPFYVGCFREVQNTIRDSVKRLLEHKIEKLNYGRFFNVVDNEIRGVRGCNALFGFYGLRGNALGIKSLEGLRRAWVEEANTCSQGSLDTLLPTIRASGSESWFSWNPDLATDPVDTMFRSKGGPPPDSVCQEVNYWDNPFFPDELRRMMEYDKGRDPDKYAHIWCGKYRRNSEARVFKNWCIKQFETPANVVFLLGADWGFSVDPSVLVRAWVGRWDGDKAVPDDKGRTLFVDYEAYGVGIEIDRTPALFDKVPGGRSWKIIADSARPETISYMKNHGYPLMEAANKGKGSVEDGIEFLKNYDIVVHPRCKHTSDELAFYSWKVDKLTGQVTSTLCDDKNHVIDSLRYAVERLRKTGAHLWAAFANA